ncbi:hypothetical protein WJX75_009279 [Coccomyxa subellipsoidea]|uniref:Uncharacterized protein n=1 Tax=Coccomyxa subellipsoidea TaxID=248742 RepID=A0ABR2Z2C6_9CHLO
MGRLACDSLLFEVELDSCQASTSGAFSGDRVRAANVAERVRYLTLSQTLFECRLLRDVRAFQGAILREEGRPDTVVLASKLAAVGYRLTIRTALGGGSGRSCFHNLHHEFLLVSGDPEFGAPQDKEYIVDPYFRDQFHIPQPTPAYEELMRLLPEEYVGTSGRLVPLVQLLCEEMGAAFDAQAFTCPPWRQAKAMLSKWLPTKVKDVDVSSPRASDGWDDMLSAAVSPTTPLDHYQPRLHSSGTSPTGQSSSFTTWWSKPAAASRGNAEDGTSAANSPDSSIKLERSTSLLSRNLASKAIAEQAQKAQPAAKPSLAAHLQAANLERFLSDEHPPIRRVKMVGLKAGLLVS